MEFFVHFSVHKKILAPINTDVLEATFQSTLRLFGGEMRQFTQVCKLILDKYNQNVDQLAFIYTII